MRKAIIRNQEFVSIHTVRRFLPDNYSATLRQMGRKPEILIYGEDVAGWTLDDYVIPRLASGLIFAKEIQWIGLLFYPSSLAFGPGYCQSIQMCGNHEFVTLLDFVLNCDFVDLYVCQEKRMNGIELSRYLDSGYVE